jgi:hypothetical protein
MTWSNPTNERQATMKVHEVRAMLDNDPDATWQIAENLRDSGNVPVRATGAIPPALTAQAAQVELIDLDAILNAEIDFDHPLAARRREFRLGSQLAGAAPPQAGFGPLGRDGAVDWRNRFGTSWITSIRDQNPCGACVDFSTTALIEAMVRIEHCLWTTRSEGDLHDGAGRKCADGWWPDGALDWIKANGIADPGVYPWNTDDQPYAPTSDRAGRTTRLDGSFALGTTEQQKLWIDLVGPVAGCFEVFEDFFSYGGGVYRPTRGAKSAGWHCVLFVGYDDATGSWICKNSWGPYFGESGFFRIAYGTSNVDTYPKFGARGTNPDPQARRRSHAGNMFESGNGALHRNFEMLATTNGGPDLQHSYRDGGTLAWGQAARFPAGAGACPAVSATTYGRNIEAVYVTTGGRLRHCYNGPAAGGKWVVSPDFGPVGAGVPGFIQGDYGHPGNFEVVAANGNHKLEHWWRDSSFAWHKGAEFGNDIRLSGPALIQNRKRELEVVALRNDGCMQRFRRDADAPFQWHDAEVFGNGEFAGNPIMIEATLYGTHDERDQGNYEFCAVSKHGTVVHYSRQNSTSRNWDRVDEFGQNIMAVAGLLEGSFGFNFEAILLRNDRNLQHYWYDGAKWQAGVVIGQA